MEAIVLLYVCAVTCALVMAGGLTAVWVTPERLTLPQRVAVWGAATAVLVPLLLMVTLTSPDQHLEPLLLHPYNLAAMLVAACYVASVGALVGDIDVGLWMLGLLVWAACFVEPRLLAAFPTFGLTAVAVHYQKNRLMSWVPGVLAAFSAAGAMVALR
jgi:hypothetical protein